MVSKPYKNVALLSNFGSWNVERDENDLKKAIFVFSLYETFKRVIQRLRVYK